jgi:uncharacterized protein (TIGR02594 family)
MTIHRRTILGSALAAGFLPAFGARAFEPVSDVYKLHEPQIGIDQMIAESTFVDSDPNTLGRFDATKDELLTAKAIVEGIPANATPYQIALYFKNMTVDKKYTVQDPSKPLGKDNPKVAYNEEWGQRANPVIKEFFAATKTTPQGDCTPWCAAFVNWCVLKSKVGKVLGDAGAVSFKKWGDANGFKTETPQTGDICVTFNPSKNRYHVTFVDGVTPSHYYLLGGNQGGLITDAGPTSCPTGEAAAGKVKISPYTRDTAKMQYFFYTMPNFRA